MLGGIPEWPKGADCKSVGTAFEGSNPSPTTEPQWRNWQTRRTKNPVRVKSSTGSIPVCGIKGLQLIEVLFSF